MGYLIIAAFVANVAMMIWIAVVALKIKNGPVATVTGRIGPLTAKGKMLATTGQQALEENKERLQSLGAELKGIVDSVRPNEGAVPKMAIDYGTLMTGLSVLRTVRGGWTQIQHLLHPGVEGKKGSKTASLKPRKRSPLQHARTAMMVVRVLKNVRRTLQQRALRA